MLSGFKCQYKRPPVPSLLSPESFFYTSEPLKRDGAAILYIMQTFRDLGLTGASLKGVLEAGYESPTPVQIQTIPLALSGDDLVGCAQTGTGKTAAFVLPTIQHLSETKSKHRGVRALVITPTRELAVQVERSFRTYGQFTKLWSMTVYGGVSIHKQQKQLRRGVDIVVATPGRLLDLLDRGSIDLSSVEVLILDEADRMFDMGFIKDIRSIVREIPRNRQTLLFSATMPKAVHELTRSIQKNPEFIEVGERNNPADTVTQSICKVAQDSKMSLLCHILENEDTDNVIVFSRTKHRADKITRVLGKKGFAATAMHSNKSQNQRQKSLDGFKRGKYDILVATDVAARGIDIDKISHVINYDTPGSPEDYVHRIGRTGRANAQGIGITFVTAGERGSLRDIERHTGQKLDVAEFDGFEAEDFPTTSPRKKPASKSRNRRRPSGGNGGGGRGRNRNRNQSNGRRKKRQSR